jgi:hypothetical protein
MAFSTLGTLTGNKITTYNKSPNNTSEVFSWTEQTSAGSRNWIKVSSSGNGNILMAGNTDGYFYISTDSGNTWIEKSFQTSIWRALNVSSDGMTMIAGGSGGGTMSNATNLYVSLDSGNTWNNTSLYYHWKDAASSSDGTKLFACATNRSIYTSYDSGTTWVHRTNSGSRNWTGIASSSDGTKIVACVDGNYIYSSADSGVTWKVSLSSYGPRDWSGVASSSDGTKLFGVVDGLSSNYFYNSTNSGTGWAERTPDVARASVTSSASGNKVVTCRRGGHYINISSDLGVNWQTLTALPAQQWWTASLSSDGTKLCIAVYGGSIYTITGL